MTQEGNSTNFEEAVLPHLGAAHSLARWLTRNSHDAEDLVQEACLRAFRFFGGFQGGNTRAWLLKIVRNTCYTWWHQNRAWQSTTVFDEQSYTDTAESLNPEGLLLRRMADQEFLEQALGELPVAFREVLILVELEGFSYKQIAKMLGIPIGTVMSRLARARNRLRVSAGRHLLNGKTPEGQLKNRPLKRSTR